jgi:hypothetical protein
MKKTTSLLFYIIFIPITLFSQVTLTDLNSPSISDQETEVSINPQGITPGEAGPNQKWTFTNFVIKDSAGDKYINPQVTPYFNTFPLSNVCLLDTCYNYYIDNGTSFELVGVVSHNTIIPYSNPETILTYPFTYNSTFSDSFAATVKIDTETIYRTGNVTVTGDAYGDLTLPIGTFNNALRLKHVIDIKDSTGSFQFSLKTKYTIYEWYVPGKKFYVFKIINTSISIPGYGNVNTSTAFYNPGSMPTSAVQTSDILPTEFKLNQNFPNPFNPSTVISYQLPVNSYVTLKIYNMLGEEVKTLVDEFQKSGFHSSQFTINSSLPSGFYLYKLKGGNYSEVKKMMLLK